MEAIVVSNLTKDYGKFRAVNSISFSINEGERFGFLGPNGAGKTTTIRSILGLLQKTHGTVSILGKEINPLKNVEYRNHIGYLPGELGLPKEKNGKQILRYIAGLYSDAVDWTYVEQIAARLQLDMERPVGELSKGNKQKIGVIATLMLPFRILILDEPTSGLDPLMQKEFFQILKEHQSKNNCTVLLSSHLLPEVEQFCERVAIIRSGKIVETSSIQDLKEKNLKEFVLEFQSKDGIDDMKSFIKKYDSIIIQEIINTQMKLLVPPSMKIPFVHEISAMKFGGNIIRDIDIHDTSLESIFMQYYQTNGKEERK